MVGKDVGDAVGAKVTFADVGIKVGTGVGKATGFKLG